MSLEAYYRSSSMRFDCGTAARLSVPPQMLLSEIDRGGAIRFRLLVIAPDGSGQILGVAEGLRPVVHGESQDRKPLLALRETYLESELWRLEIDHRDGPTLCVNNAVSGLAAQMRSSPLFQGLVLPHAFRIVLRQLGETGEDEDDTSWSNDWRIFLRQIGVDEWPEDNDADSIDDWIEASVKAFCMMNDYVSRISIGAGTVAISHD